MTTTAEWSDERLSKIRRLIRDLYSGVRELELEFERKFTLDGHLVGSIGEVVAAYAYGLHLLPASSEIHDAQAEDGTLVQVKLTAGSKGVSLYSEPVHLIVLQLTNQRFHSVYNGPGRPVWTLCGTVQKNGQRRVSLAVLKRLNVDANIEPRLRQLRDFPVLT